MTGGIQIMITQEQFSAMAFQEALRTASAGKLSEALQKEVLLELHAALAVAVDQIVRRLNQAGHQLTPYTEPSPGDFSYRDEGRDARGDYFCRLRLGIDVVVSAGFADVTDADADSDQ